MLNLSASNAQAYASRVLRKAGLVVLFTALPVVSGAADWRWPTGNSCPDVYKTGVFPVPFNAAFTSIGKMTLQNGNQVDGLVVSSFFNAIKTADGVTRTGYFERDLVARIEGIGYRNEAWWNKDRDVEIISDLDVANPAFPSDVGQTVWPNEVAVVPDGILPFGAVVVPEGFHITTPPNGRMTIINIDDPNKTTYIVDVESELAPGETECLGGVPRFYHEAKWFDMDGDALKDLVTVRSGFKATPGLCWPQGELVWFKNPGASIDPNVEWDEFIVSAADNGPEITLGLYDFEGDGVPEVIANNFFAMGFLNGERIQIFGAPIGDNWTDVDLTTNPVRVATISSGQGSPFGLRLVDLNRDGQMDVLATNHQGDNCKISGSIPGKIYALEQPTSGDIFNDPWTTHILMDNIRPNITVPTQSSGPGRLAPGLAQAIWPTPFEEATQKPWIVSGGDEASKVWLLKPNSESTTDWSYQSAVIFDINDYYGPNTSQTFTAPAPATGISISTIGSVSWRYDRAWSWGSYAEIYIPVFEGRDIHRISFRPQASTKKVVCPADVVTGVCSL
ncbi:MAG: hypothetical protein GY727_10110 [Gammaproteobacteria bacterium]|nr:hypothetical protein [Gammaproteobacteria bacterium]MCP4090811.1 hypothetical protein [Gammaproteobacteria bacterium]MCP4277238.1 hypothetical protein [Gammaproteobacteria bacterium]MCP4832860.1 hypothetical protein [Gammaproteobacteria bacterium]MCP4928959.1 hypothetical protein [Gammaproteobacteria bacterium]